MMKASESLQWRYIWVFGRLKSMASGLLFQQFIQTKIKGKLRMTGTYWRKPYTTSEFPAIQVENICCNDLIMQCMGHN